MWRLVRWVSATSHGSPPCGDCRHRHAVPIIGIIAAAMMLGEPLGIREALAMMLTLAGVALALQKPKFPDAECRMKPRQRRIVASRHVLP
jgi:drug/metabolite transporter (DMT)-like permease